jgi:hypothetical protein
MEDRLNTILNTFEESLIGNFNNEVSDFDLKNSYIDLKYDFLKLILEATHKPPTDFNFDLFHEKVKRTSPLHKDNRSEAQAFNPRNRPMHD